MNKKKYNQTVPPEYNISNIKIPMALFYADNDLVADHKVSWTVHSISK